MRKISMIHPIEFSKIFFNASMMILSLALSSLSIIIRKLKAKIDPNKHGCILYFCKINNQKRT